MKRRRGRPQRPPSFYEPFGALMRCRHKIRDRLRVRGGIRSRIKRRTSAVLVVAIVCGIKSDAEIRLVQLDVIGSMGFGEGLQSSQGAGWIGGIRTGGI